MCFFFGPTTTHIFAHTHTGTLSLCAWDGIMGAYPLRKRVYGPTKQQLCLETIKDHLKNK